MPTPDGSAEIDRDLLIERILRDSSVLGEVCSRLASDPVLHVGRCGEGAVGLLVAAITEKVGRPFIGFHRDFKGFHR